MTALERYHQKRNFKKTKEPEGKKKRSSKKPVFVIQQHAARAMHYDLRLEIDGVMPSWAVPKGPSLNPAVKRLAVMTEDHPLDYRNFEGIIPKGEYGAGPVIIWDRGTYKNIKEDDEGNLIPMKTCLKDGRIEIFFNGKKIKGAYALIRTGDKSVERSRWLLVKMRDEYAHARKNPVSSHPESVKTGKTIKDWKKKIKEQEKKDKK